MNEAPMNGAPMNEAPMNGALAPVLPQGWWTGAVVYQVYVRSFADSNGDGIGDLDGVRSRLTYLADLGVDAIWLNPCYPSPQRDHGYDVSEYTAIEPAYGDLDRFDQLVADAHALGIRVLMDIVPNHCSSEHPWFQAALAAEPASRERARFYFRDGRGPGGAEPPNNWHAMFGGSAWTPVGDGQWYLGTFTGDQPDFDHTNPDVAEFFDDVLTFWFDRDVDGFRVDAVSHLGKAHELPDAPPVPEGVSEIDIAAHNPFAMFRPEGHVVWRRWRALVDRYMADHPGRDLVMVAEAYTPRRPDLLLDFARPDQFHQCFAFDLILSPWEVHSLRQSVDDQLKLPTDHGVMPTWTLNNHDCQRIVTRLGRAGVDSSESYTGNNLVYAPGHVDLDIGLRRARALIALLLALPGSVYLYQGEELGLPEVLDLPDSARQDPIFIHTNGAELGRDGCRVPMPWTRGEPGSYGFSGSVDCDDPWLPLPDGWGEYAVDAQAGDPSSMLEWYRLLLQLRREHADPNGPVATVIDVGDELLGLERGSLVVVLNPTATAQVATGLDGAVAVATSAHGATGTTSALTVPADATTWFVRQ
jgi:alpha-glucosidase